MGDLLSAALTEAGLDEFLSEPSSPDDRLFENIVPVNQTSNNVGTSFHEECILQPSCSQELHLPGSDSAESIESIRDIKQVSDEGREIRNCPQAKSSDSSPLVKQSASNCGESSRGPVNSVLSKSNQTNSDQTIYARSLSTKQPNLKRLPADHLDVARCLTNRTSPLSHGETQTTHPKQIEKIAMCDSAKSPSSRQIPGTSPPELFVECDLTDRTTQSTQFTTEDVPSGTHRSFTYGPAILRSRRSILVDNTKIVRGVSGRTLLQRTNASPVYRAVTGTRTLVRTGPPVRTVIRNQTPINRTATGRSQQRIVVVRQSSPNDTVPYMGHPHETMIRTNSSPHLRTVMVRQNGTIVRRQRAVGQRITEWSGPYATPAFHISRRISSPLRENSQLTCSSFRAERGPRYVASSPSPPLAAYSRSPSHSSCLSQVPPGGGPVLRKVNTSLGSAGSMIMNSPRFAGSNQIRATRDGQPSHAYLALPAVAASAAYPSTLSRSMKRSASSPQTMNGVEEVATTPCSYAETRRDQIGVQTKVSDYDVNSRGGILLTSQSNRLVSHRDRKQQWQVDELLIPSGKVENIKTDESIPVNVAITKGYLLGSTTGSVERRNTVKQERRLAKDEMKAALEAGIEKSMQEMDDEEENLGYAETYSEYRPAKLRSGLSHPDSVVETASLSSVAPPEVRYNVSIPEELIDTGSISAIQLEAVIYACQAHESRLPSGERSGYLIGDGAGVGKGRTVACIIFENYLLGRKRSLWLSVSSDLKFDAERDLRDIGAKNIKVHALNKFKYAKISGKENGNVKKGCVFATYSSLIGECRTAKSKYRSRLKQLIQWCGQDFEGVIVFDECHRAKNLVPTAGARPTKTGRMVMELQKALPNARIVYASATGATEPRNMAYMTRLGLWGEGQAFAEFSDFINAVERRGVGAMEIVAMDMKQRGLYLARQLSFRGVSFRVEEVPLSPEFVEIYDDSVKLWLECRRQFQAAINALDDASKTQCKHVWGQFWAAHQRFFKYLCIGAKVGTCVRMTREAVKANKCVVIGLQSTGEARTLEQLDDAGGELTDFVSTAKAVLTGLIDKHFPTGRSGDGDIFRDFDKMFSEFDRPVKRRKTNFTDVDVYTVSGSNLMEANIKRPKHSNISEDEIKEESSEEEGNSEESADSSEEVDSQNDDNYLSDGIEQGGDTIEGDEDAWLRRLLDEAKSSSEDDSDEDTDDEDGEKTESDEDSEKDEKKRRDEESADDDFNPFACDFTQGDPWATKQTVVEDSPKKTDSSKEMKDKKKKKRKRKLKAGRLQPTKKRFIESEAMMGTADAFITSSHIIDGGEGISLGGSSSIVKAELLTAAEKLGTRLPPNTLDQLIDELGGPEYVAEMTGRKGRVVSREDGEVGYELRHTGADVPLELMNMDEKDKFMKGEKLIAIISEAASSGISLQSDRRALNRRRRVHITLELPWSADKAIQQFGRTHRSNQVSAPEYVFLISELAGEKRFASIVAKRLESLGALTHGDRRATESRDLSQFNLDTRYGRAALDVLLRTVIGTLSPPLIPPPTNYKPGDFLKDMCCYMEGVGILSREKDTYTVEKESATIPKFLNRILGLPVHAQNALFQYFSDIVAELVAQAKHDGTYDMGIMDLGMGGDEARKLETRIFLGRANRGNFRVEMHKIGVERGVSWEDAYAIWKDHHDDEDGFYISTVGNLHRQAAALVYGIGKKRLDTGARLYCITRPNTGRSPKLETMNEICKRFRHSTPKEVEKAWKDQYEGSYMMCQHTYFYNKCKSEMKGVYCETGRRTRTYFVLSGSVLSVWPVVEEILSDGMSVREIKKTSRMQIVRVRTEQNLKIVGLLVLPQYVRALVGRLEDLCGQDHCYTVAKTKNPAK